MDNYMKSVYLNTKSLDRTPRVLRACLVCVIIDTRWRS